MRKFFLRGMTGLYFFLVFLLFSFFFFTNDFGIVDIQKSALVVGVGVDRAEDGYEITAQLAVPQSSDQGQLVTSVEVSGKGPTVGDAITTINATTGWYPKLNFCKLILLGRELATADVYGALEYFLRNENISDEASIAICDGTAKEFLCANTPTNDISTLAIQKLLSEEAKLAGVVTPMSLRKFSISYFSDCGSAYIPLLKRLEQTEEETSGAGEQSGGKQSGEQKQYLFDATSTALFRRGREVGLIEGEQTTVFSMFENDIRMISYPVRHAGIEYTLGIRHLKKEVKVELKDGVPRADVELKAYAIMIDSNVSQTLLDIAKPLDVDGAILQAANETITKRIVEVIRTSKESLCDLLCVRSLMQKKYPRLEMGDDFLATVRFSVNVSIENL